MSDGQLKCQWCGGNHAASACPSRPPRGLGMLSGFIPPERPGKRALRELQNLIAPGGIPKDSPTKIIDDTLSKHEATILGVLLGKLVSKGAEPVEISEGVRYICNMLKDAEKRRVV